MKGNLRYILAGLAVIITAFALWYFKNIVAYILVAAVFSLIGRPVVDFLSGLKIRKIHFPMALNAAITLVFLWTILLSFFLVFIPIIINQAQELSHINIDAVKDSLEGPWDQIEKLFLRLNPNGNEEGVSLEQYIEHKLASVLNLSVISSAVGGTLGVVGNLFVAFFSISFITFFFLKDETLFADGIMLFVPTRYEERFGSFLKSTKKLLTRYFIGILLQITGITILNTIGLTIVGLKFQFAAVIGLITGIMNVIPYIGPIIGASIGLLLGIANNLNLEFYQELLPLLGYMALVFAAVQVIDNVLFQPLIYGTSVKAHPLEVFLVILIAGSLAGIRGMILAIPGYTVLRVFAREFFYKFKLVKKITDQIE